MFRGLEKTYPCRCATPRCRRLVFKSGKSPYCSRCRSRRWAENSPLKYSYAKLRYRAKERGHAFKLTFEQYRDFAIESGYALWKGKSGDSLSIDRIDPSRGYEVGNIRAMSLAQNSRRRYLDVKGIDVEARVAEIESELSDQDDGCSLDLGDGTNPF